MDAAIAPGAGGLAYDEPRALAADRAAFERALARSDDLLDEEGAGARLAEATKRHLRWCYGRYLSDLLHNDKSDTVSVAEIGPAARVTRERVATYVDRLRAQGL